MMRLGPNTAGRALTRLSYVTKSTALRDVTKANVAFSTCSINYHPHHTPVRQQEQQQVTPSTAEYKSYRPDPARSPVHPIFIHIVDN